MIDWYDFEPTRTTDDSISDEPLFFGKRIFSWGLIPEPIEVDDEGCCIPHSYSEGCYACDGNFYACLCGDYDDTYGEEEE